MSLSSGEARADRQIGRRQRLGDGHAVGFEAVGGGAEPVAGAAEAGDDLVGDQQDAVLLQHRDDGVEITLGREDHAAGAHHRLGDHRRDGVGAFLLDQGVEVGTHADGELLLGLAGLRIAIVMRAVGEAGEVERQVEAAWR